MQFAEAVDRHLAAVTGRDLAGYQATLHPDVSLIMLDGRLLTGRDAVLDLHRAWFGDPDWSWSLTPLWSTVAGDTGVAVFAVEYRDLDADGRPYELAYSLGLTFVRVDAAWLLLHDQNTRTS
ncbi:nuclear transport factor 2 family protein [Actinoplanes sp. NEAU-A12]|uniref:Nuclear transport factor 2 family protein n=1 Tax=Actinoplanes sandaracinus TaxID=3045177 RepID=A0ABT6WKF7_9ACTN|nr:nuclear transport factor 2 family protein [Actinoplanes sandaracinus]MDI6100198.1 nuclear transport factor 2 family protein [Actinoplanes sandaracinus]